MLNQALSKFFPSISLPTYPCSPTLSAQINSCENTYQLLLLLEPIYDSRLLYKLFLWAFASKIQSWASTDLPFNFIHCNLLTLFGTRPPKHRVFDLLNVSKENLYQNLPRRVVSRLKFLVESKIQPLALNPVDIQNTMKELIERCFQLTEVDVGEKDFKIYIKFRMGYRLVDILDGETLDHCVQVKIQQWIRLYTGDFPLIGELSESVKEFLREQLEYPTATVEDYNKWLAGLDKEYIRREFSDGCFLLLLEPVLTNV